MTLDQVLQTNQLNAEEAYQFILSQLDNPAAIYNEAMAAGLSVNQVAELVGRFDSTVGVNEVAEYFRFAGLDPEALTPAPIESSPSANARFNEEGVLVIDPAGPLNTDQLLFVGGLIESSYISDPSGSGAEQLITASTPDGLLINVQFNNQDFANVIFNLSPDDARALDSTVMPVIDEVYDSALAAIGFESWDQLEMLGDTPAGNQAAQQLYDVVGNEITAYIKPQYDQMMALQGDLWF